MRVLVVCDRFPWPLTNGQNLRIYHYVRELRSRHRFDLLCYGEGDAPDEVKALFERIDILPRPQWPERRGFGRITGKFDLTALVPRSEPSAALLAAILEARGHDVVWVSGWDQIVNLPRRPATPVLADAVDDGVMEFWREFRAARGLKMRARTLKWVVMNFLFERRYFGSADRVLFVSEDDASVFRRVCPGVPVEVVHNGVDTEYFRPGAGPVESSEVVFEGSIGFSPNVDGLLHLAHDIWPLVRAARPDAHLTIVGRDPPPEIVALAAPSITVTGYVDDVRPYVERAAVVVSPLRKGAGIKNKLLQAWSMGKAVVASSKSLGGLQARDGVNIVVRDAPDQFAAEVVALMSDAARARALGDAGRRTILAAYTWSQKAAELERVLNATIAVRRLDA